MDNRKKSLLMYILHQEGFLMPRSHRHISNYEKEILELKAQGQIQHKLNVQILWSVKKRSV